VSGGWEKKGGSPGEEKRTKAAKRKMKESPPGMCSFQDQSGGSRASEREGSMYRVDKDFKYFSGPKKKGKTGEASEEGGEFLKEAISWAASGAGSARRVGGEAVIGRRGNHDASRQRVNLV